MADLITRQSDGKTFDTSKILAEVYDETNRRLKVDASVTLTSDINIGNVQVYSTDGTDANTKYGKVDSTGQVYVLVKDSSGNTLGSTSAALDVNIKSSGVTIGGNAEQTPDAVAATKIVQSGGIAETTVKTAVADGDAVATWYDEYGRQVLYGANLSANAIDTNIVNQALLNTITVTNLSGVTATGAGTAVDMSNFNKITVSYKATSAGTGGTILTQGSLDNDAWYTLDTEAITTSGITYFALSDQKHKYIRTNLTARTDGTYTTIIFGGN
jgi:hypothetical protein